MGKTNSKKKQPKINKSKTNQSKRYQKINQSEIDQSKSNQSSINQSEIYQSKINQSNINQSKRDYLKFISSIKAHNDWIKSVKIFPSGNIISVSSDKSIKIFDGIKL